MAYTSGRRVKSTARKQDLGLTISAATRQARKIVYSGPEMPGTFATVESRFGHDLEADIATVVTTITFPENERGAEILAEAIREQIEHLNLIVDSARIVITRKR